MPVTELILKPVPLSPERFAPFGEVIETASVGPGPMNPGPMNDGRFDRFDDITRVVCAPDAVAHVGISIVRSRTASRFPHRFDTIERHPLGSQAFIPLERFAFVVVVAAPAEIVGPEDLRAFVTNGRQGVNYRCGTWHMPLVAAREGQEFLVVDRRPGSRNCEERVLERPVILHWS